MEETNLKKKKDITLNKMTRNWGKGVRFELIILKRPCKGVAGWRRPEQKLAAPQKKKNKQDLTLFREKVS